MVSSLSVSTLPHLTPLEQARASLDEGRLQVYRMMDTQASIPQAMAAILSYSYLKGVLVRIFVGQVPTNAEPTDLIKALSTVLWWQSNLSMCVFPDTHPDKPGDTTYRTFVVTREAFCVLQTLHRRIFFDPGTKQVAVYHGNNQKKDLPIITRCFDRYANCGLTIELKHKQQAQTVYPPEPTTEFSLHTPLERVALEASSHGIRLYVSDIPKQAPPPFTRGSSERVVLLVDRIPPGTQLSWLEEVFRSCVGEGPLQYECISFGTAQTPKEGRAYLTVSQAVAPILHQLSRRLLVDPTNLQRGLLNRVPTKREESQLTNNQGLLISREETR